MKEKIKEYLEITIQTKRNMRRRINKLEDALKEAKDNEKDALEKLNKYKKNFVEIDKQNKIYEIENKKITKELKKLTKQLEKEQAKNEDLQIDLQHSEEKYNDLEQDLHDNFRRIPVEEQYDISDRDFI